MSGRYDDIINLPHPTSQKHPRMSAHDRAAQFSPFAALTGHQAVLQEAVRQTEARREMGEEAQQRLDRRLQLLLAHLEECPKVRLCYFQADGRKAGGTYLSMTGMVERLDSAARSLRMADGTRIPIDDLWDLDGPLFSELP